MVDANLMRVDCLDTGPCLIQNRNSKAIRGSQMAALTMRNNLGPWTNEPVVQDLVLAYMEQLNCPAILREIYIPLGLPRYTVNRVLGRLHTKGVLIRSKIPVTSRRPDRDGGSARPDAFTRQCYLYSFAEGYA